MSDAVLNKNRIEVCRTDELPPGTQKIFQIKGKEIGIFNVSGTYHAVLNFCPHEGAPVCRGHVSGTVKPSEVGIHDWGLNGQVLACPWHGWEFNLEDGRSLHDARCRLKTYRVEVEDDVLYVIR